MGNTLRCCLACVLPCGALDMIRIVHLDGYVEEMTGPITADEVLKANPNHFLSKPCSQGVVRKILILSPESHLKRGSIYFLIPSSSMPAEKSKKIKKKCTKKIKKCNDIIVSSSSPPSPSPSDLDAYLPVVIDDKDAVPERNKSSKRSRRRSSCGVGIWQPHLESITED